MYRYSNFQKNQKAVALGFDEKKDPVPKVLATGKGEIAEKIMQVARENNVPMHRDAKLVEILSVLDIDEHIPLEVYSVVAEILTCIYEQETKKQQSIST
ncbi:MAG: FlhB-like flagellar biosynthesis protein [Rickettsiaceae bacterium]